MRRITAIIILAATLCLSGTVQASAEKFFIKTIADDEEIYLALPLLDFPYQSTAMDLKGGFLKSYANQSMATTMALTNDFVDAGHYGLRQLLKNRWYARFACYAYDELVSYLPFGPSWAHEEYHRAVMTLRGVDSFDEIITFPIGASSVSVSHETDEALQAFHDRHPADFIRMNAAGAEAQTHWAQTTQRNDFFYHRTMYNGFGYWSNLGNNFAYIDACRLKESDKDVEEMNAVEGDIEKRDFTGLDFSAWAYELFHPGNLYTDRGVHPSGVGVDRYIKYDQIGEDGLEYLRVQKNRELLNMVSPFMFGMNRFRLFTTEKGDWYGNFSFRHYLTSFGDDISLDLLFESPSWKFYATPHIYGNWKHSFPGLEAGFVDRHFFQDRLKMNASFLVWSQPNDFFTDKGELGGSLSFDAVYSLGRWEPYLTASAKTSGWQAGNVYLDENFSFRMGLRWRLNN